MRANYDDLLSSVKLAVKRHGVIFVLASLAMNFGCSSHDPDSTGDRWNALIVEMDDVNSPRELILCIDQGAAVTVQLDSNRDYGFDLSHLSRHMDEREPVLVVMDHSGLRSVVTEIRDSHLAPSEC